jgi:hypothetical protein
MKRLAIASIVGSIILYIYLALAHVLLPIHNTDFSYTPAQDTILRVLKSANLKDEFYLLPAVPPGTSREEQMKAMEAASMQPGALINYYPVFGGESGATFIMSFIYNFIAVLVLCIALATASDKLTTFGQRLWFIMLFVLFVIFSQIMLEYNWVRIPMHYLKGQIIDLVIGYLLVGVWLAWYYGRLAAKDAAR